MLSGCAYVAPTLAIGASVPIFYASGKAIYHENKKETQDSIKQAVADSLNEVYPTVSPDSLPAMVETAIEEKKEASRKATLERLAIAFLGLAASVAVVLLFVLPLGASPGLGD